MRGEKHELHAADEIGAGHHHEGGVGERDPGGDAGRRVADFVVRRLGQRNLVHPARVPGGRNHQEREHHKACEPHSPAVAFIEHLPDRRRQQRAERSRARHQAEHRRAHRRRHGAGGYRHRNGRRGTGERGADQNAAADHDAEKTVRGRHQRKAGDIKQRACHHDGPKTVAHCQRAGERLQKSPGEILHRERQREIGH